VPAEVSCQQSGVAPVPVDPEGIQHAGAAFVEPNPVYPPYAGQGREPVGLLAGVDEDRRDASQTTVPRGLFAQRGLPAAGATDHHDQRRLSSSRRLSDVEPDRHVAQPGPQVAAVVAQFGAAHIERAGQRLDCHDLQEAVDPDVIARLRLAERIELIAGRHLQLDSQIGVALDQVLDLLLELLRIGSGDQELRVGVDKRLASAIDAVFQLVGLLRCLRERFGRLPPTSATWSI
jgi:hypothetical protein